MSIIRFAYNLIKPLRLTRRVAAGSLTAALMLALPHAQASSIYKCVIGGRVTYSGTVCKHGSMREMQVSNRPQSSARDAERSRRKAAIAATTRKTRLALEAEERKKGKGGNVAAAGRARRCAMLQLEQRQAERKVDEAGSEQREAMRADAARRRARMAIECPA